MKKIIMLALVLLGMSLCLSAQHDHHTMPPKQDAPARQKKTPKPKAKAAKKDTIPRQQMHGEHTMYLDTGMHSMDMPMSHAFSLNLPMNRNGR